MLDGFTTTLWKMCSDKGIDISQLLTCVPGMRQNFETEHVTIVSSNVLCKLNQDQVFEFLGKNFNEINDIQCTDLRHTISLDWARFSICVVVGLKSQKLQDFIDKFNLKFGTNVRISAHITVCVKPRSK